MTTHLLECMLWGFLMKTVLNIVIKSENTQANFDGKTWSIIEGNDSKEIQKYFNHIDKYDAP